MQKILIDPHNCSREEYAELIAYLEQECWDHDYIEEHQLEPIPNVDLDHADISVRLYNGLADILGRKKYDIHDVPYIMLLKMKYVEFCKAYNLGQKSWVEYKCWLDSIAYKHKLQR